MFRLFGCLGWSSLNDKWVKFKQVNNNFMFYRFAEGQGQGSDTTQEDIPEAIQEEEVGADPPPSKSYRPSIKLHKYSIIWRDNIMLLLNRPLSVNSLTMMYCVMTGENKEHHGYISGTLMTRERHIMDHPGQVAQCLCQVYYHALLNSSFNSW